MILQNSDGSCCDDRVFRIKNVTLCESVFPTVFVFVQLHPFEPSIVLRINLKKRCSNQKITKSSSRPRELFQFDIKKLDGSD